MGGQGGGGGNGGGGGKGGVGDGGRRGGGEVSLTSLLTEDASFRVSGALRLWRIAPF